MGEANFTLQPLYPRGKKIWYPFVRGGWVGATAYLEILEKREISKTYRNYEPRTVRIAADYVTGTQQLFKKN
jgi:hypothetical protein